MEMQPFIEKKLYKFLWVPEDPSYHNFTWSLPLKTAEGTWIPGIETYFDNGKPKDNGDDPRLYRPQDLPFWCNHNSLFLAEAHFVYVIESKHCVLARRARLLKKVETWNIKTARLFAVWRAREALKNLEHPDPRSLEACDVAERYANGEASFEEMAALGGRQERHPWN